MIKENYLHNQKFVEDLDQMLVLITIQTLHNHSYDIVVVVIIATIVVSNLVFPKLIFLSILINDGLDQFGDRKTIIRMSYRVGVDIGGTFTDFCVFDEKSGAVHTL